MGDEVSSPGSVSNARIPLPRGDAAIRGTVLLVDDDPLVARAYERTLQKAGYAVEVLHDGTSALERVKRRNFDVIVSDVRMPGMSGLDLLRSVREHDLDVPVIIMSGDMDVQSAMEAMEHGAFRYIGKPVDLANFLNIVARALRLHQVARIRREAVKEYGAEGGQLGDRAGLEVRFGRALEGLWMAYQPIVSCASRSLFAYEALVRTEEPTLRSPCDLFDAAERLHRVHELGGAIRKHVADTVVARAPRVPVFVNVHPEDLDDPTLFAPESPLSRLGDRVVLEITERAALDQVKNLMARIAQLRSLGYRIALDDLGAGYAGLASFAHLEPEIVKVDMSIVRGIEASTTKQRVLGAMAGLCRDLDIQLVTEGIETVGERDTVLGLGGDVCQGYLFARPNKPFPDFQL